MKKILVTIISIYILTNQIFSQNPCFNNNSKPSMGINLPEPRDIPWVNLWNNINPWHSTLELGNDGWPTEGRKHRVIIGQDIPMESIFAEAGVYKVNYKGKISQLEVGEEAVKEGAIAAGGVYKNLKDDFPKQGYAYVEIHYSTIPKSIDFKINGHIEDVVISRPGFEIDDKREVLPKYADLLQDFTTIRFTYFLMSNNHQVNNLCQGPASIDWKDRAKTNAPQSLMQYKNLGGSWEHAVAISNELNKDMWINIPVIASDNYIVELAEYIKANLKPTLKVNIEIGNDTWNFAGGFCSFRQIQSECKNDWDCHRIFPAKKLKTTIDHFAAVFPWNEINNRIRGVLCGQIAYGTDGNGWSIKSGLTWMEKTFGEGSVRKYFYAVGAAPFFSPNGDFSSVDNIITKSNSDIDNNIFGEFSDMNNNNQFSGNKLEGWFAEAGQYGLKLYAYEGGPDMDYNSSCPGCLNNAGGTKDKAMRDPRMKEVLLNYWNKWFSRYGSDALFCFYQATFNNSGLYTLGEDINITSTRQEAMNEIMKNPAPPFNYTYRHTIPGEIDARKIVSYGPRWDSIPYLQTISSVDSKKEVGSNRWMIFASKNGTYDFSIERKSDKAARIDVYVDDVKVYDDLILPSTNDIFQWSNKQGIHMKVSLTCGPNIIKIVYEDENGKFKKLKFLDNDVISANEENISIANGSSFKVFPNPAEINVNYSINLSSTQSVKIALSDLAGKELMVIKEGKFDYIEENFNISNIANGAYSVNFYLNGKLFKSQLLMKR